GVALAGMGTGAALKRQPFPEKNRHMGGHECHDPPPDMHVSQVLAMSVISCGVLSRYQDVLETHACPIEVVRASVWRPMASRVSGHRSSARTAKVWRRSMS